MMDSTRIMAAFVLSATTITADEIRTLSSPMSTLDSPGIVQMRVGQNDESLLIFGGSPIIAVSHSMDSLKHGQ